MRVSFFLQFFLSHTRAFRCSLLRIINRFLSLFCLLSLPLLRVYLSLPLSRSIYYHRRLSLFHFTGARFPEIFSLPTILLHATSAISSHLLSRLLSPRYSNLPLHHISLACSHEAAGGGLVEVDGSAAPTDAHETPCIQAVSGG